MKHFTRILSLLLALILTLGLLPAGVQASPSYETVTDVRLFVAYPMSGEHPSGQATRVGQADYTVDYVHYFNCYNGQPTGGFLGSGAEFIAGRLYACQVHLVPRSGWAFYSDSEVRVNGREPDDCQLLEDGSACYTVFFTAAAGTVTVRFDSSGHGKAPAAVEVPQGGCLADAVADVTTLNLGGVSYKRFVMWSENPFATVNSYDYVSYTDSISADTTLYAVWLRCPQTVELYVTLPGNCLESEEMQIPEVIAPSRADYTVTGDYLYLPDEGKAPNFHLPNILDFCWPYSLERGQTYYSRALVELDLGAKLPTVNLHGAALVSVQRLNDYTLEVIYSLTIPAGNSLNKAALFIETPKAGQSATTCHPQVACLTPGLSMSVQGWYTTPNASGDWYEGTLQGGQTYYALVGINGSVSYNVSYSSMQVEVFGKNAELVQMADLGSWYAIPNYTGAVVAVTIPRTYSFTVEVPYGGGKFRSDRFGSQWVTIMDFSGVEEGPIVLEALADPSHLFMSWYDAQSYDTLSTKAEFTYQLNGDVHIKASFVDRPPFVDVGAHDYYYWPVMWAIEHEPQITAGVDATHFGPKQSCTREQIVTFLWNACHAPNPVLTTSPFSDVKPKHYFFKPVLWASENNITSGVGNGKFGVGQTCTREQAMTFLWASYGSPDPEGSSCPFSDVKPNRYYYKAILWAVENGVTSGVGEGRFGVGETCTRAQIMTFLYHVYGPKG